MKKQIENIVFYKYKENEEIKVKACIFFKDGTVKSVSLDEGKKYAQQLAEEKGYTTIEEFNNSKNIYYLSGNEFIRRMNEFMVKSEELTKENEKSEEENKESEEENKESEEENKELEEEQEEEVEKETETKKVVPENITQKGVPYIDLSKIGNRNQKENDNLFDDYDESNENEIEEFDIDDDDFDDEKEYGLIEGWKRAFQEKKAERALKKEEKAKTRNKKKKGFPKKAVAIITALALATTGVGASIANIFTKKNKAPKPGHIKVVEKPVEASETTQNITDANLIRESQKNLSTSALQKITKNQSQLNEMRKANIYMDLFNISLPKKFKDDNSNIKPALKWAEVMSLNLAYNNFTPEEIKSIYNGSVIDVTKYDGYYKNATLQLMGAFVMEEKTAPINLDLLINSQKGKDFYNKYNDMFLSAKEATGTEKIKLVNNFYQELGKDFPITEKERVNGISHGDSREKIKSYKLAITPIVAASEMLFQNLEIDHTMSDKVIEYFNDNGLCNRAKQNFEAARAAMSKEDDINNPTYEQYKTAKIRELKAQDAYNIKDKDRNIMKLSYFQKAINQGNNGYQNNTIPAQFVSTTTNKEYTTTKTTTEVSKKETKTKETTNSRNKAIKKAGSKAVKDAENKVDKKIAKENKNNKETAEKKANTTKKELQENENKKTEENKVTIENNNKDLENKIDNANETINNNNNNSTQKPVNEKDFGDHNVDFDNNHSDSNGNLDDSVKDITTDKTDANEPLPNPNETGKKFDDVPSPMSNEEKAAMIVEEMAQNPTYVEESKVYVYTK